METAKLYLLPDGTEFKYINLNTVQDRVLVKLNECEVKDKATGKIEYFDPNEVVFVVKSSDWSPVFADK